MKKINYFFAAAMICMSVAACVKEAGNDNPGVNSGNTTEETIPDNYIELIFQVPDMDVKTSVDGNTVSWTAGDKIRICWDGGSSVSNAVVLEEGNASFTAMVAPEATDFYAVYPSTIEASVTEGNFNVTIPSSQSGRFADADIIVAKTSKDNLVFAFHHAVSLVKFVISEENAKGISRAQFVDLANNSQLTGALSIAFDESNAISANTVVEKTTEEINAGLDVIDVTAVQPGDNYMAVIPSKELTGFGLRLGSASKWYTGLVSENATVVERLPLGTVDTRIHEGDFHIKPEASGKGDGTSWEDAGGPEFLQSLIGSYESGDAKNLAILWRINEKIIKVAEGNYISPKGVNGFTARYVGNESVAITIEGGYTSSGDKAVSAKTVFGPATETDPFRAFFFYGDKVHAILKDLTISGHKRTGSAGGGALYATGGVNLIITDCNIENNSTANGRGGGAILIDQCTATFQRCIFSNNTSDLVGGAVMIDDEGNALFDECDFIGNSANADQKSNGGALYLKAPVTIQNCTFTENWVHNSTANNNEYGNGGAIYSISEITMSNCLFNGNYASDGGALFISQTGNLKADKCKFIGNHTDGKRWYLSSTKNGREGSGVFAFEDATYSEGNTASAYFNACEFKDNYASSTVIQCCDISFIYAPNTSLGFNNCIFYENQNDEPKAAWDIYTRGNLIIVNSTMIDNNSNAVLYPTGDKSTAYNNIVINSGTGAGLRGSDASISHDYNIISKYFDANITQAANEAIATSLESGNYSEVSTGMSYYSWSGSVEGFLYTNKTNVANTIKSNETFGQDFYEWLTSLDYGNGLNALDVDIRGVERTQTVWPGSYQN